MGLHPYDDGTYAISSRHVWRPGIYESERAARYAYRFSDEELQALQDSVNPGGVITFAMLRGMRGMLTCTHEE